MSSDKHKNTNFYCTFEGTDSSLASQNDQGGRVRRRKMRFLYESFSKSKNNTCEVDVTDLPPFLNKNGFKLFDDERFGS